MAHLGRGEYALLLHLSDHGRQPLVIDGNKAIVGDDGTFRVAVVNILVSSGLVTRIDAGDGATELELSAAGRSDLDTALGQKWVVNHSGVHDESQTYRFEVPDPVTGRRFVVAVSQEAGLDVANRAAYGVIAAPSVRVSCRKIDVIGEAGGFSVQVAIDGAGKVAVWRKL